MHGAVKSSIFRIKSSGLDGRAKTRGSETRVAESSRKAGAFHHRERGKDHQGGGGFARKAARGCERGGGEAGRSQRDQRRGAGMALMTVYYAFHNSSFHQNSFPFCSRDAGDAMPVFDLFRRLLFELD